MKEFDSARDDFQRVVQLYPANKAAKSQVTEYISCFLFGWLVSFHDALCTENTALKIILTASNFSNLFSVKQVIYCCRSCLSLKNVVGLHLHVLPGAPVS